MTGPRFSIGPTKALRSLLNDMLLWRSSQQSQAPERSLFMTCVYREIGQASESYRSTSLRSSCTPGGASIPTFAVDSQPRVPLPVSSSLPPREDPSQFAFLLNLTSQTSSWTRRHQRK